MLMINGSPAHGLSAPITLAGTPSVEQLQRALINLAIATNRPAINPGSVSGTVDDATMAAINAAIGILTEELPTWLYLGLQAAMLAGSMTAAAKKYVEQYAAQLTIAANTAAVKYKTAAPITPATLPPTGLWATLFPSGWYTRPSLGWLIVLGASFAAYKLFLAKPAKSAA
jgi:hypothetical protein